MSPPLTVIIMVVAFLLGAVVVAEYLSRRLQRGVENLRDDDENVSKLDG